MKDKQHSWFVKFTVLNAKTSIYKYNLHNNISATLCTGFPKKAQKMSAAVQLLYSFPPSYHSSIAPSITCCSTSFCLSQQHHHHSVFIQTQYSIRSFYLMGVYNGWAIHLAAVVSLPSLAVSAILSLPSPGAVGALPDATVSLSTPMERSTGRRKGGWGEGCTAHRQHHTLTLQG